MEEKILAILEEVTGTDEVSNNLDLDLFSEGLLDSLGSVQLLVELEGQLGRDAWATPRKIIQQVPLFQNA